MKHSVPLLIALLIPFLSAARAEVNIDAKGKFIDDCTLAGEQKKDWLHPSHPFCAQLSAGRFLWVYQTRGFSGIDSEHSIIYQLRADHADGPILKEGFLSKYREDWDLSGDGKLYIKSHGHPKVTGVPKGAINADGKIYPAQNVFLATWYIIPALRDPDSGVVDRVGNNLLECVHFRLNDEASDIEFLDHSPYLFREKGFEKGRAVCSIEPAQTGVNQWLIPATPLNDELTRWADALHFPSGIATIEIRFAPETKRYQWVRTGALVTEKVRGKLMEGSLHKLGENDWILGTRARGHHWGKGAYGFCVAWYRTDDPFKGFGEPTYKKIPSS